MILVEKYTGYLNNLANEYFIQKVELVSDLASWAKSKGLKLSEPAQPMKLIMENDDGMTMAVQSVLENEILDGVINAMSIRWVLRDTVTDMFNRLNSVKKKLCFYFLKEYARTVKDIGGDEMIEDDWALREMERFGCFRE